MGWIESWAVFPTFKQTLKQAWEKAYCCSIINVVLKSISDLFMPANHFRKRFGKSYLFIYLHTYKRMTFFGGGSGMRCSHGHVSSQMAQWGPKLRSDNGRSLTQCSARELLQMIFFFVFLGLHLWHMEVTRLGVKLELQLLACHHSHSNAGSKLCLQPTPSLLAMPDP